MLRTEPKVSAKRFQSLTCYSCTLLISAPQRLLWPSGLIIPKVFRSMSLPPGFDLDAIHIAKLGQTSTLQIEMHFRW